MLSFKPQELVPRGDANLSSTPSLDESTVFYCSSILKSHKAAFESIRFMPSKGMENIINVHVKTNHKHHHAG